MSRHAENLMDELPDLRSDVDVDALMARIRARITPPPPRTVAPAAGAAGTVDGTSDLVALQEAFASTVVRAMAVIVDALEEFAIDDRASTPRPARPRTPPQRKRR